MATKFSDIISESDQYEVAKAKADLAVTFTMKRVDLEHWFSKLPVTDAEMERYLWSYGQ